MRERVTPVMTLAQISHLRSISITDTSTAKQCMRVALVTAIAELPALTPKALRATLYASRHNDKPSLKKQLPL